MQGGVQPTRKHNFWQALRFGLPLALLELAVLALFYTNYDILRPVRALALGLLLYLVVAALAGYWFCRHGGKRGVLAGLRVGLLGAVVFLLAMIPVFAVLYLHFVNFLRTCQLHACGPFTPADYRSILASFWLTLALLSAVGVLLSALGGWLGGLIAGQWTDPQGHPGEQRA